MSVIRNPRTPSPPPRCREGRLGWWHPGRVVLVAVLLLLPLSLVPSPASSQDAPILPPRRGDKVAVEVGGGQALFSDGQELIITGSTDAPPGSEVLIEIGQGFFATVVDANGTFRARWPKPLETGTYAVTVTVTRPNGLSGVARQVLIVEGEGRLPRRPLVTPPTEYDDPEAPATEDFQETTDRWRIVPPPYEINVGKRPFWDPYNQNKWKGDLPIKGQDLFLNLTVTSDTLVDVFTIPTPSGVSASRPASISFFGRDLQTLFNQNVFLSADLFKGDTAFKPFDWRIKGTLVGNLSHLATAENAIVKPDVRRGTSRTDGRGSLQELFVEVKLADLSPNYDFLSIRAGIQPFSSDFRGFIFTDMNLGVRLFGNYHSNRDQFNLAFFERLEKDTNSGLNLFEFRDQRVAIANYYRQDFLVKGYTSQWSVHYLRDDATFQFDRNGFLVRPDPFGTFTPHEIEAWYLGWTSFGHIGRFNIDSALYYVFGDDSQNPLAGRDPNLLGNNSVEIQALMAALEVSYDFNWFRPKFALFYASGDDKPRDRNARGFDAIFENPQFAGGGFSFWNRLGIRLPPTGVALIHRGSLLPDLTSSKEEGQPNFVNPGIQIVSLGVDLELTPKLKGVATANYLRFDQTEPIEFPLFQAPIDNEIGWDLSLGAKWRPYLNQNLILVGGVAALLPGEGFSDIYEDSSTLFSGFVNLILTY